MRGYGARVWAVAATSLAALAPIGASTGPAAAATPLYYLALGDSLAVGAGASAGHGYVDDIFAFERLSIPDLQLVNLACGGATTSSMINGGGCSYATGSQLGDAEAFIAAHPGQVAFVTIDIGGNDVLSCAATTPVPKNCVKDRMPAIKANFATILERLRAAGGTQPIVGLTYYDPFVAYWLNGGNGPADAKESVKQVKVLNAGLKRVLKQHKDPVADGAKAFDISNFRLKGTWNGNTVPVTVQNACNWTRYCTAGDIHANDAGYAVLASAFEPVIDKARARR